MKILEITINGKSYPCGATMGAMLRFREISGKEITDITTDNLTDLITYLYCCIKSACAREKVEFPYELMEFADAVSPDEFGRWSASVEEAGSGEEKKTVRRRKG